MATTQSRERRKPNIPLGSTAPTQPTGYDVFLSFRGEDTRRGFASHLDAVLSERGVVVYRDDDYEHYGAEHNSQIRKAIESSRISMVILSRNYASSTWCLDELQQILDCRQVTGQKVLPVFYDVYPSQVRRQTGSFADYFANHERRFKDNIDKVHAWRDALRQVADLSGFALGDDGDEAQFVDRIVEFILDTLQPVAPDVKQQRFPLGSMATTQSRKISKPNIPLGSTAPTQPTDYDVYLSFRGEDTRRNFASHLHAALSRNGVVVYRDDDYEHYGAEHNSQIRKAIESSRISIVILSRNYASSTWCLDELQQILDCRQVTDHKVLPVFFDVHPSEVRRQTGSFAECFAYHEQRCEDNIDKVRAWRDALRLVADLSGFALGEDGYEAQLIRRIVEFILNTLQPVAPDVKQQRFPLGSMATTQSRKISKPNISLGSTAPTQPTDYDVYLGFRGEDTRRNFASHLHAALSRNGVVVYRDDDYEHYGAEHNSQIRKAFESSRISMVILSRNYASSTWCLDELQQILDCRQVTGQKVLPVFYDVYPSQVRRQTGSFADYFANHERRFEDNIDKVHAWRDALRQVADLSGFALGEDGDEAQFVDRIVEFILDTLQPVAPDVKQQRFPLGSMATTQSRKISKPNIPLGSTAPTQPTDYDVYLSFRGEDTRRNFASHLHAALSRNGVVVYRDDDYEHYGAEHISQIRKAIESSRISIVILSRNYASSTWCLDELQQILDCRQVTDHKVLPVFFDVDPFEVRRQTGSFAECFAYHEQRCGDNIDKVRAWRDALRLVADLSGFVLGEDGYEAQLIRRIVEFILNTLQPVASDVEQLVGIGSRVEQLNRLLDIESNDVRFIGIWGMGGIGKTTIADVIFNNISIEFEIFTRIRDIRGLSETQGDLQLQKKLLYEALRQDIDVPNVNEGATMIKNLLCKRKVLLILDDVDNLHQLESLAGNREWFGLGSRVIITTRNEKLLRKHGVDSIFEVKELSEGESLQLFNIHAFKSVEPPEDYLILCKQFVNYCRGIPFAIKVLGSSLFHRSLQEWHSVLKKREHFPDETVPQILEISYHGLADNEKRMFLDIACFFQGMDKERVVEILDCFGFNPKDGMEALIEKSLITISNNKVLMNGWLQEMGRQVVRRDAVEDPGEQSRLWLHEDIIHVLRNNTGTNAVEGIALDLPKLKEACWDLEAFSTMHNLRFLQIHNLRMTQGPKKLSNALKFLEWSGYPSKFLPREFELEQLCEVNLCHSSIGQLWNRTKCLGNLKFVNVSYSQNLTRTPDFTVTPNLHRLILEGCRNLVMIHPSIAELKRLIFLNLKGCRNLEHLPKRFGMESLQILILSGCSKINKVPEFVRPMENLLELYLDKTAVEELPSSIECLTGLTLLNLRECRNLSSLASSTCQLRSLQSLNLSGCSKLEELPKNLGKMVCLKELDVGGTSINDLPSSISRLENLELLSLCGCKSMGRKKTSPLSLLLPTTYSGLFSLIVLNLSDCNLAEVTILENLGCLSSIVLLNLSKNSFVSLPRSITELSKLQILNLGGCKSLKKLPDLSAELNFSVEGKRTYSQERLSSCFSFINCFEVIDDQGCNNVAFAALRRFLEGIPYAGNKFEAIYPGSEISEWFSYRSERPVVSMELPRHWYKNEWMGYALCAVFTLRRRLPPNLLGKWNYGTHSTAHGLRCEVKPGNLGVGGWCPSFACSEEIGQIEKEHLWLSFVSGDYFGTTWQDSCHHLEFTFKTLGSGLEVKRCGVRLIYERDLVGLKQPV